MYYLNYFNKFLRLLPNHSMFFRQGSQKEENYKSKLKFSLLFA